MECPCAACTTLAHVTAWAEGRTKVKPDDEVIKVVVRRLVDDREAEKRRLIAVASRVEYDGRDDLH